MVEQGAQGSRVTADEWRPHKLLAATLHGTVAPSGAEGPRTAGDVVRSPRSRVFKDRYAVTQLGQILLLLNSEAQPWRSS